MRRLSAAGIQSAFQFYNINSFESVERLIRRGVYKGPLVMNWVAISGGMDQANIYNLANFLRAIPDGAMLTVESSMRNVLPINMMGMAMGLHVRCGTEDGIWNQRRTAKQSTVQQIEQLVNDVESAIMATDEQEISSKAIGDQVMRHLRELDDVAYIRFASVYRSFADIGKLREAVDELLENS